jgi:hypothetical protein
MRNSKASAEWNGVIKSGKGGMNVGGITKNAAKMVSAIIRFGNINML